jgi:hypothetical protein
MAVTEVLRALGSWELRLKESTPRSVWDAIEHLGHIAIHAGPVDVRVAKDSLLASARYVGVVRSVSNDDSFGLSGSGLAFWLGDEEGKGAVLESLLTITAQTFENSVRLIVPSASSAILEGTYFNLPGPPPPFTGTFQWQTQREALNYLSDMMGADWKILGTGRLMAGPAASLFVTDPKTVVTRRLNGVDLSMRGYAGRLATSRDVDEFTTRVVLLGDDGSGGVSTGTADILPGLNPYKDLHGATVRVTRMVQENATDPSNADARAQLQLNRFTRPRDALELSTSEYDVKGDLEVGDYLWVYDPDLDIVDPANERIFRSARISPMSLRLTEMTWPVSVGMHVAYRDGLGNWIDLTDYLQPEDGDTTLVVSGFNKSLGDGSNGGIGLPVPPPQPNLTIPDAPTWVTPFSQGTYQSPINGETKAQTELRWTQPLNTDGTSISDGAYYEIRYRSATTPLFPVTHAQMAVYTHAQLNSNGGLFGQPIQYPVGDWQYMRVPFDQLSAILYELTPSMPYEAQVRAVDNAPVANAGAWATLVAWQTAQDTLPPASPAAPEVAASLIAVQITHRLGRSTGGTFNLDKDLHHLEIHGEYEPGFQPSEATRLGRLLANFNMMVAQTPVIGTFPISDLTPVYFKVVAVDSAGNKSGPSAAAVATAQLIDDAHISNLSVSKLTAGTVTASFIHAGWLRMGSGTPGSGGSGPAVELTPFGIQAFNSTGVTFDVDATTGNVSMIGMLRSGSAGRRMVINDPANAAPEIEFYPSTSSRRAFINALDNGSDSSLGLNSSESSVNAGEQATLILHPTQVLMQINTIVGNAKRGGYVELFKGDMYIGCRDDGSGTDAYHRIEKNGAHRFTGYFAKTHTDSGRSALYIDQVGGSGTNASITYGATMASVPLPFVDIQPTTGGFPGKYHCISGRSTTGCSVEYPSGNCDIFILALRYA